MWRMFLRAVTAAGRTRLSSVWTTAGSRATGLQDPILLDEERQALSRDLPTSGGELAKRIDRMAPLLARLRGNVTLSYSCHNLADDREMFPSSVILSAFRILSGQHDGRPGRLESLAAATGVVCARFAEKALTESEWWLWRMSGTEEVVEPRDLVARCYPHLGRGFTLAHERESDRFTIYDGWIPEPGAEIDPTAPDGPLVSASQLETLGQCPFKYFFRYVLKIGAPEELTLDPDVWLDPLARGSLLHEVFELFVKELIERGDTPDFARDEQRLLEILDERIEHYRARDPPAQRSRVSAGGSAAPANGCGSSCAERKNIAAQRATGRGSSKLRSDWRANGPKRLLIPQHPVEIRLPDGRSLRARGRIDRIDQVDGADANVFAIWDYKTGGTWKYAQDPRPFWEGRVVQHVLSILVMNARLKAIAEQVPGAKIDRFGFFFPSEKGAGERIEYTPAELEQGAEVLARLARIAANGRVPGNDAARHRLWFL